jgi:hypothetical protein
MGLRRPGLAVLASMALAAALSGGCRHSHTPTESEAPSPTPPPTPTPFPPPPLPCPLPPGGGSGERCPYQTPPQYALDVNEAIAIVENEHKELFDFGRSRSGLSYFVWDRERYARGVAYVLSTRGACAVWDGVELGVKKGNEFNEQYAILTSDSYVRWGAGAYQSTCYPAWF